MGARTDDLSQSCNPKTDTYGKESKPADSPVARADAC